MGEARCGDRGLGTYQQVGDLLEDVDDFAGGLALVDGVELRGHGECVCGWGWWHECISNQCFCVDWRSAVRLLDVLVVRLDVERFGSALLCGVYRTGRLELAAPPSARQAWCVRDTVQRDSLISLFDITNSFL